MDSDFRKFLAAMAGVVLLLVLLASYQPPIQRVPGCLRSHQAVGGSFFLDLVGGKSNGGLSIETVCDQEASRPDPAPPYPGP